MRVDERGVDARRGSSSAPAARVGECARILPHPSRSSGSRRRPGSARSAGDVAVVVGKRARARDDAERATRSKKRCGIADAGDRATARAAARTSRGSSLDAADSARFAPPQRHRATSASRARRSRATRRAGTSRTTASTSSSRDGGSRSGPAGSISRCRSARSPSIDGDLDVARERVVLQAVVGDHDVARRVRSRAAARAAATRSRATATGQPGAREQQRLVADARRDRRPGAHDGARRRVRRAVAAADDARVPAARGERVDERDHERRLAVPPTVMLPTTTTGTRTRSRVSMPRR